jgi:hypothetical protein
MTPKDAASERTSTSAASIERGRDVYAAFIEQTSMDATARKATIEQKGLTVVTTAGTLVTLLFAVISFVVTHAGATNPHQLIKSLLIAAAVLFVLAAVLGLVVSIPVRYGEPDPHDLLRLLFTKTGVASEAKEEVTSETAEAPVRDVDRESRFLSDSSDVAAWQIALARTQMAQKARTWNAWKAAVLSIALLCEVSAMVCLTWGIHRLL